MLYLMIFVIILLLLAICEQIGKSGNQEEVEEDFLDCEEPKKTPFKQRFKEGWADFKKDLKEDPYKW